MHPTGFTPRVVSGILVSMWVAQWTAQWVSRCAGDAYRYGVNTISAMEPREYKLKNGHVLLIRDAAVENARAVLDYVEGISGESDFLSFGPGEFELTEPEE